MDQGMGVWGGGGVHGLLTPDSQVLWYVVFTFYRYRQRNKIVKGEVGDKRGVVSPPPLILKIRNQKNNRNSVINTFLHISCP